MKRVNRIYIAGPWDIREMMPAIARRFEDQGFEITKRWWEHDTDDPNELRECAVADMRGVRTADVFVVINSQKRGEETSGKAVETGLALAYGIPIILVGERSNIFHHLDEVAIVNTVETAAEVAASWFPVMSHE